jgi:heptosyltransferase-1
MGDIIHALPAVATLKHSFPNCHLAWAVNARWAPLLDGNPFLDEVICVDRRKLGDVFRASRRLRAGRFDTVVDFQGLIKSALAASAARPDRIYGFHQSQLRERLAALFYSHRTLARSAHVVDRNLELATAVGASNMLSAFPLPPGEPEGRLPMGGFVLASPLGGWPAKQWPLEYWAALGGLLTGKMGLPLVLNGPPEAAPMLESVNETTTHVSGLTGLIDATRRALAVVGVDSGPLHLAAALGKPGVAIYGPTDPERNGPYGDSFTVLRSAAAKTSYKRRSEIDESMKKITPEAVVEALEVRIADRPRSAGSSL